MSHIWVKAHSKLCRYPSIQSLSSRSTKQLVPGSHRFRLIPRWQHLDQASFCAHLEEESLAKLSLLYFHPLKPSFEMVTILLCFKAKLKGIEHHHKTKSGFCMNELVETRSTLKWTGDIWKHGMHSESKNSILPQKSSWNPQESAQS